MNDVINFKDMYLNPADKCTLILKKYNKQKNLSSSDIREINTFVSELYQINKICEINYEELKNFFELQYNILYESKDFNFDLIEISLLLLSSNDLPNQLYNDKWMNIIVERLYNVCNQSVFVENYNMEIFHRLYTTLKLFALIIEKCSLTESILNSLIYISIKSFFFPLTPQNLHISSCSLLCSIFRKKRDLRNAIINDIFVEISSQTGINRTLIFPNNERKHISSLAIIIIELVQSVASFSSGDDTVKNIIAFILNKLFKDVNIKFINRFCLDIYVCMFHPIYPASFVIMNQLLPKQYSLLEQKNKLSKLCVKLYCNGLSHVIKFNKMVESYESYNVNSKLNIAINGVAEERTISIGKKFSKLPDDKLIIQFLLLAYSRKYQRLHGNLDTTSRFYVHLWSNEDINQKQTEFLYGWYYDGIPEIGFDEPLENVVPLYMTLVSSHIVFTSVLLLVTYVLQGFQNSVSTIRAHFLDGFTKIIEVDSLYLYHPDLVPLIINAFVDPCDMIRFSVLELVSAYILNIDQVDSCYFHIIIKCLYDKAKFIVLKAVETIGKLSETSTQEQLIHLCEILSNIIDDSNKKIYTKCKLLLNQCVFEYSTNFYELFLVIHEKLYKKKVWEVFIKECYAKYPEKIQQLIIDSVNIFMKDQSVKNALIIKSLSGVLPSLYSDYFEKFSIVFLSSEDIEIQKIICSSMIDIIPFISYPKYTSFVTLLKQLTDIVMNSTGTSIVQPSLELIIKIVEFIMPEDEILKKLSLHYEEILCNKEAKTKNVSDTIRAVYILGVIIKFAGFFGSLTLKRLTTTIGALYSTDNEILRQKVLDCIVDICIKFDSQIDSARILVGMALNKNYYLEAIRMTYRILYEERFIEDTLSIDKHRINIASDILTKYETKFLDCLSNSDTIVRTEALKLIGLAVSYGMINLDKSIVNVIGCLSFTDQYDLASNILNTSSHSLETVLRIRFKEGMEKTFAFVNMYPDQCQLKGLVSLYPLLNIDCKTLFLKELIKKLVNNIDKEPDDKIMPFKQVKWLVEVCCSIEFEYQWEPNLFIKYLDGFLQQSSEANFIKTASEIHNFTLKKEGSVETYIMYCNILLIKMKRYIMRKYEVKMKNIYKLNNISEIKKDKKRVRRAIIDDFNPNIPEPEFGLTMLNDNILDLYAMFQSLLRHERATVNKYSEK